VLLFLLPSRLINPIITPSHSRSMVLSFIPKRWHIKDKASDSQLNRYPKLSRAVVQVLCNRGIIDPFQVSEFLNPRWAYNNPFLLKDMEKGVQRLTSAIAQKEPVVIFGDFDADGLTATSLLFLGLKALGAEVSAYIPDRFNEGYGLSKSALENIRRQGAKIVISADCGIRSMAEVGFGNDIGLEFIITDHHHPLRNEADEDELPPALAVIDPKRKDCSYPYKHLAGVGLAYKLLEGLTTFADLKDFDLQQYLDLVALGTVADLAPLTGENRYLVIEGLKQLNQNPRPGVAGLIRNAHLVPGEINAKTIGFVLGPRLNASGRLAHAQEALELLVSEEPETADRLAAVLNERNSLRQNLTREQTELARQSIDEDGLNALYFIADAEFHKGVVGLVASRLVEDYYRPMLIGKIEDGKIVGSARSIPEFHITNALDYCRDLLIRHGGHAAAAGFTLAMENRAAFEERLLAYSEEQLRDVPLQPVLEVEAELNLKQVKYPFAAGFSILEPWGIGNPEPAFVSRNLVIRHRSLVGADSSHLKLYLYDGKQCWDSIGFSMGRLYQTLPERIDAAYTFIMDEYQGEKRLRLRLDDIKPAKENQRNE
jgi:single-stranded-DNA-specific exonuclease